MELLKKENYKGKVKELIEKSKRIDCAIAFWGAKAEDILQEHNNKKSRFICNLESGATNPWVIQNLDKRGLDFRTNSKLHAKVYIGDKKVIIGSANISANGLSYEDDELKGWIEAGIISSDKELVKAANSLFNALWDNSYEIDKSMITAAKKIWKLRKTRNSTTNKHAKKIWKLRESQNNTSIYSSNNSNIKQKWMFVANPVNYDWNNLKDSNEDWDTYNDGRKRGVKNREDLTQIQKGTIVIGYQSRISKIVAIGVVWRDPYYNTRDQLVIPVKKAFKDFMLKKPVSYQELRGNEILSPLFSRMRLTFIKMSDIEYNELIDVIFKKNPELINMFANNGFL